MSAEKNVQAMRERHAFLMAISFGTNAGQTTPTLEVYRLNKNTMNQTVSITKGRTVRIPATATRLISIQS